MHCGSPVGSVTLGQSRPWSGTALSSLSPQGQPVAKRSQTGTLGLSGVFCLLVSTRATLWEREHSFSIPQLPCPLKKEIQVCMSEVLYPLWVTFSGWVLSLVLAEAHSIRLPPQPCCSLTRILPPAPGAKSICEEGVAEAEVAWDVREEAESQVRWWRGQSQRLGRDVCGASSDLLAGLL